MEDHSCGAWAILHQCQKLFKTWTFVRRHKDPESRSSVRIISLKKTPESFKQLEVIASNGKTLPTVQKLGIGRDLGGDQRPFIKHSNRCAAVVQGSLSRGGLWTATPRAKRGGNCPLADAPQPQTDKPTGLSNFVRQKRAPGHQVAQLGESQLDYRATGAPSRPLGRSPPADGTALGAGAIPPSLRRRCSTSALPGTSTPQRSPSGRRSQSLWTAPAPPPGIAPFPPQGAPGWAHRAPWRRLWRPPPPLSPHGGGPRKASVPPSLPLSPPRRRISSAPLGTKPRAAAPAGQALIPVDHDGRQSLPRFPGSATGQGGSAAERDQRSPSPSAAHTCFYFLRSLPPWEASSVSIKAGKEAGKRRVALLPAWGGGAGQPCRASPRCPSPWGGGTGASPSWHPAPSPRGSLTASFRRLVRLAAGWGSLRPGERPPPLGPCMAGLSSLCPGGFGLQGKARSCSSWNKSCDHSLGRLGVAAGRVSLTTMSSHVKSGHSKEAKINWVLRGLHLLVAQHGTRDAKMLLKITA